MRVASLANLVLVPLLSLLIACGDEPCPPGTVDFGEGCLPADASADAADGSDGDTDGCMPTPELCNEEDDDCDGTVDEGLATSTFYRDGDGDEFGDDAMSVEACAVPDGYITTAGDCDDDQGSVHPGVTETCDGVDQDCDLAVDEGLMRAIGAPRVISPVDRVVQGAIAITSHDGGYVAVYGDTAEDLYLVILDATGAVTGSPLEVAPAAPSQFNPAVLVMGAGDAARAVVAYSEGTPGSTVLRARSIPLDGSEAPAAQTIGEDGDTNGRPGIDALGDLALINWHEDGPSGTRLRARLFAPSSGLPMGLAEDVASNPGIALYVTSRAGSAAVASPDPYVLMAYEFEDDATGIYAARFSLSGSELVRDEMSLGLELPETPISGEARALASLPGPDGGVSSALAYVLFGASGEFESRAAPLSAGPLSEPLRTTAEPSTIVTDGVLLQAAPMEGSAMLVYALPDANQLFAARVGLGAAEGGAGTVVSDGTAFGVGASIAAAGPAAAAVAFTREVSPGNRENVVQRLGCE